MSRPGEDQAPAWYMRRIMLSLQGHRCFYCHRPLTTTATCNTVVGRFPDDDPKNVAAERTKAVRHSTLDHLWPLADGGSVRLGAAVASCLPCNWDKRDREPTRSERDRLAALFDLLAENVRIGCP